MKEIRLKHGEIALVDDNDYFFLSQWKWHIRKGRSKGELLYAITTYNKRISPDIRGHINSVITMHSCVMDCPESGIIDHIDGNGLNNQKSNLRFATISQNNANRKSAVGSSSKYLGVAFVKNSKKRPWMAQIRKDKKAIYLGAYQTEEEAAKAYDNAATIYHGEFARLNFKS